MRKQYDLYDVILRPLISEKANILSYDNKYTFFVNKKSDKHIIKNSIEFIFNVKVDHVNTSNILSKNVRFKGVKGKQSSKKKAIVTLVDGYKIDLIEGS